MRPKKQILVVDSSEDRASCMSFMLETNGYRVFTAKTYDEAEAMFLDLYDLDLALVGYDDEESFGPALTRRFKQMKSHVPIIMLGNRDLLSNSIYAADAFLERDNLSSAELLERIKIMSARKRGPRKGYIPHPRPAAPALRAS